MPWGSGPFAFPFLIGMVLSILAIATMVAAGENSPPEVALETPQEGDRLGLTVTVSGTATDVEGFNISSLVEMRWNTWEWFALPSTPALNGTALHFGQTVDLQWHAPGEHHLQVRAFDGELWSEVVNITVVRRDLPDLVVMPTDITIDPPDAVAGDEVTVSVVVQNQGGEGIEDVTVVLSSGDREVGSAHIKVLRARGTRRTQFHMEAEEGPMTLRVTANAEDPGQEASEDNNNAERTFLIAEDEGSGVGPGQLGLLLLIIAVFLGLVFWAMTHPKRGPS